MGIGKKFLARQLAVLVMVLLALTACGSREITEESRVTVEVAIVERQDITSTITLGAQLKPQEELMVFVKTPGLKVTELPVKLGDTVRAGDLLFELDKGLLRLQVEQAKANYEMARSNYVRQRGQAETNIAEQSEDISVFQSITKNLNPLTEVMEKEIASITTEGTMAMAEAQLEQARMAYSNSLAQLSELEYYAPMGGIVSQINIQKNQMAINQLPAMVISDDSRLKANLMLTPQLFQSLRLGQEVMIKAGDQQGQGQITLLNPIVDQRVNLHLVEVTLNRHKDQLRAGSFVQVELVKEARDQVPVIPKEAILMEKDGAYVYTVEKGRANRKKIKVGIDGGNRTEVLMGLGLGEQVIIKGQHYLEDGMAIQIRGKANGVD